MRSLPAAAIIAAALSVSACIPERDNPLDPAGAPDAVLRFTDGGVGTIDSPCEIVNELVTLLEAPRDRCLVLLARGTTDPQDGVEGLTYDFRFEGVSLTKGTADHYVLDRAAVLALPPNVPLTYEVVVTDRDGNYNVTEAQVLLRNQAPTPPRVAPRTLPHGGYPWAPGEPIPVSFGTETAADPDGSDTVQYCWTFPSASEICSTDPNDPAFTVSIEVDTPGRFVAELRVRDAFDTSEPRVAVVNIAEPNAWILGATGAYRVDTSLAVTTVPGADGFATVSRVPGDGVSGERVAVLYDAGAEERLTLFDAQDVSVAGMDLNVIADAGQVGVAADPGGTWLWTLATQGDSATLRRWDIGGLDLTPQAPIVVDMPSEGVGYVPVVEVDGAGRIWASRRHGNVYVFDGVSSTAVEVFLDDSGRRTHSIERRPGTNEVWFIRTVPLDVSSVASATLHRVVEEDGQLVESVFQLGTPAAVDMAWYGSDRLWIGLANSVVLVDVDALVNAPPGDDQLALATIVTLPELPAPLRVLADPVTGDVWAFALGYTAHGRITGTVHVSESAMNVLPDFIGEDGRLWSMADSATGLIRYRLPPVGAPVRVPQPGVFSGASDWNGGLWFARTDLVTTPVALAHVTEDGIVDALEEEAIDENGEIVSMPWFGVLRTSPGDTSHAYGIRVDPNAFPTFAGIVRIDLDDPDSTPTLTEIVDPASSSAFVYPILEPSAPLPASTPFLWTAADLGSSLADVGQLDPVTGAFTSRLTANEPDLSLARSLHSNGACVGFRLDSATTDTIRARWISAAGSVTTLQDIVVSDGGGGLIDSSIATVATSRDPAGVANDLCWIAWNEPGTGTCTPGAAQIRGYLPAGGAAVASYTLTPAGRILSMKPLDRDRLWLLVERCEPGGSDGVAYLEFVSRSSGILGARYRLRVGPSSFAGGFADPEVSFEGFDYIF